MRISHFADVHQLFLCGMRIPELQIVGDGVVEEDWLLLHDSDNVAQPLNVQLSHIVSIEHDVSSFGFVETRQETD